MTIHEGSFGFDVGIAQIETATGRFLRANPRFCNLVGYSPQELERLDLQALTHPDDWEAGQVHRRRFVEGEIGEFEWVQRYRHKDGHCLRVKVAVSSLGSPGERPLSHIAVVQNITESNPAAAALWQRGEDFAHLLEVTRTLAMTLDLKRVLQAGSDGASRLLELGSAAIYLRDGEWLDLMAATPPLPPMLPDSFRRSSLADHPHIREALTTRRPVLLPDTVTADLAAPEREIAEALRLRTLLFLPLVAGEKALGTLIVGSVGAPRPISEAQIDLGCTLASLAALAVVNARLYEAGQRHVADLEREVADRKRAEAALRESEERLRLATDAAQMGVWERDLKSDRLVWSPMTERLNGFEQGTFPGTEEAFRALVHPDSLSAYMTARDRVRQGDGIYHAELHLRLRDGRDRWGLMSGRLIRDARGQPERIVGVDLDITERKRAEMERERLRAQLTQAQKMESVGRLAGGVAHDFNNMLGVILGHIELALDQVEPGDPLRADLEEIRKATQRSADLTRQLLAFARKQTIAPKVLDLNATIEGMVTMLRRLIGEDIELAWLPGRDLWPVRLDPSQVDQILANLCVNARDAISGVGKITLETGNATFDESYCAQHAGFTQGDYVLLAVSDTGCGMDAETLSHLFEPFFTTKAMGQGTGLGLATVYGAIKQNRGFIQVYSEPGRGTTFKIYLPRHMAKASQTEERKPQAATPGTETILLVEDEPTILNLTRRVLQHLGYSVLAARTPGEAIRLAREHPGEIDLLFSDVVLPEMNGRELAKNLQSIYPNIRRLFMSGYTANVIAHQGVLDPGVHFIQKPFSPHTLGAKVREVLEG